ncbi:nucleoside hydrolase [Flammeovirgaceae bacterium 311]|nr:nucleoside hydrolase [Flammeovirgaceae bacterium 311]
MSSAVFSQVKIIFDTDLGADADDLGALAMLHGFVENKECELLGIMVWSNEVSVIPAIDAINRYYNHPDIPLGIRAGEAYTIDWNHSKAIADRLPNSLKNEDVQEATSLYRKILSENKDGSIVLVTVGPLMNIKNLIESGPDEYSDLSGKELLHRKVKEMVVMGGQYPEGKKEWNFWGQMPGVTKYVFDHIQLPVVFVGYEIGEAIRTGEVFNDTNPDSPLYIGYKYFSEHASWINKDYKGAILDNATFDQTAVLYAVKGGVGTYWDKVEGGFNQIDEEGNNRWVKGKKTNQSFLRLTEDPETMASIIEGLMLYND